MKKFGKLKLFGLLIFLSAVLVFIGVNFLESGKPPKWDWKVAIPTLKTAKGLNVYGNSPSSPGGSAVFEKNDFVKMGVQRGEDSETGEIFYHFYFRVYNNDKGYSIGFQNLVFCGCKIWCDDSWGCVFPPEDPPTGVYCDDLKDQCPEALCGGGTGYQCMEEFMETYDHPDFGYEAVAIRMYIYYDIEAIPVGGSSPTIGVEGRMWQFDIWNTSAPLLDGKEEYHNIVCRYPLRLEDVIIERPLENTWTVRVNQDGSSSILYEDNWKLLAFREFYEKAIKKPKGKSGKYQISSEDCIPLAGRTVFMFESRWTRSETKKGRPSK